MEQPDPSFATPIPPTGGAPSSTATQPNNSSANVDNNNSEEEDMELEMEAASLTDVHLTNRIALIRQELGVLKSQMRHYATEIRHAKEDIIGNKKRLQLHKKLPYLVGSVSELLDLPPEEVDGATTAQLDQTMNECAVVKTTARQVVFLPAPGLVPRDQLEPGCLVGLNRDSYIILEKLPPEYDARVRAMEVVDRPSERYQDVGGLKAQIQQLKESVVLPITRPDIFKAVGVQPPRGVLMYGPPGTGKTLMARTLAAQTGCTFFKLAGPQLVQAYVGAGSRMLRDAFKLARQKAPSIIFIDELDAIGGKRFNSEHGSDREVQRTMLELLNQMDGFSSDDKVKVIAATNRIDILDPALLRSGRFDRKIEFPMPNEKARAEIMRIHSRGMTVSPSVDYAELAAATDDFNGAQLKAVCVEAGMVALRRRGEEIVHEDFVEGIAQVKAKKSSKIAFYI